MLEHLVVLGVLDEPDQGGGSGASGRRVAATRPGLVIRVGVVVEGPRGVDQRPVPMLLVVVMLLLELMVRARVLHHAGAGGRGSRPVLLRRRVRGRRGELEVSPPGAGAGERGSSCRRAGHLRCRGHRAATWPTAQRRGAGHRSFRAGPDSRAPTPARHSTCARSADLRAEKRCAT
jgi:hypothetical protein